MIILRSFVFSARSGLTFCIQLCHTVFSKPERRGCSAFALLVASMVLLLPASVLAQAGGTVGAQAPVNLKASPEARALLAFFYEIDGKYTLTGQHNTPSQINYWSQRAYDLTGKYPAVFGQDLGFSGGTDKDSVLARTAMLEEIRLQHQRGAIITLTWHAVSPTDDEPVTFRDSVQRKLSDFEWEELITPGTRLHQRWLVQIDEIAGFLRQLREANIPVLWRPYHEVHGGWFWWGGRVGPRGSAELFRQMYDRYVNQHQLDNLIWVWNGGPPNEKDPQGTNYYPGSEYVDMLSIDVYGGYPQQAYDQLLQVARGKPIALGEVGVVPTAEVLRNQPRWTYFLIWSEFIDFFNPVAPLKTVFDDPRQLSRDDTKLVGAMSALRGLRRTPAAAAPVTPGASDSAKALLARLYNVSGKQVLSGHDFGPAGQGQGYTPLSYAETFQRRPAIYSAELAAPRTSGSSPEAVVKAQVEEAIKEAKAGTIISLSWKAPRPTDPDTTAPDQSARAALSDFEWRELLTPGTRLHERWLTQVDRVAATLKALQAAGVPVLWRPYPEFNLKKYWWGGRKGANGGPALYRHLFERLAVHHGLNNLIWVWTAAPENYADVPGSPYHDSLPNLLYFDAVAVSLEPSGSGRRRQPLDRIFSRASGGKPVGIEAPAELLRPETFVREPGLAWFIVTTPAPAPAAAAGATLPSTAPTASATPPVDTAAALRAVLASPQVISVPATPANVP